MLGAQGAGVDFTELPLPALPRNQSDPARHSSSAFPHEGVTSTRDLRGSGNAPPSTNPTDDAF
jgi:hypothetical protein